MTPQIADIYPLTPMQEGMLFHTLYAPESGVYSQQLGFLLRGNLDPVALQEAWRLIIGRHASFRTGFSWENRSTPLQAVFDEVELPWQNFDLRGLSAESQRQQIADLLAADQDVPYDLRRPPLVRFTLVRLGEELHQFIWSMHHLIIDGWSVSIVLGELHDLYLALSSGRLPALPEPTPFKAHVSWVRSRDIAPAESFWRARLSGFTTPTPLLGDRGAALTPSQLTRYEWVEVALAEQVTEELQRLAQRRKITLNTIIQGAWALLLSRYCGEREVVYGVVSAGRSESVLGMERIVGLCVNTLPTRVVIDPEASLGSWLQTLQDAQVQARQFEFCALTNITDWSEVPAGLPLFDSIVGTENFPMDLGEVTDLGDLSLDINILYTKTSSPLSLIIMPGKPLRIRALYDADRWEADTIQRSLEHYRVLLSGFAAKPDANLGHFGLLTEAEFNRIVVELNQTQAEPPFDCGVHEAVMRCAQAAPDTLAVAAGESVLTYGELEDHANRLAARLIEAESGPGALVAVCLGRSAENLVACLAALKTGAAYLPIDPEYPPDRIRFMLDDANPAITVSSPEWRNRLPQDRPVIEVVLAAEAGSAEPVNATIAPDDIAYVIYTSGSTGEPKAVPITHRNLTNLIGWHQRTFAIDAADRATLVASPAFDASVWETWPYLTSGGSLHVPTDDVRLTPEALIRWLCSERITVSFLPTPLAEMVINETWPHDASLRLLLTGGDRLRSTPPLNFPASLINNYGPTESTVVTTSAVVAPSEGINAPTIGRPIDNTQVYVVDSDLNPVPVGVVGELCVAGMGLTRGYLNRPEATAQRFVPNPFADGAMYRTGDLVRFLPNLDLDFVGRNDHQVKIHGYRIEPGEIEAVLSKNPAVRQAVVTSHPGPGGEQFLVAHVVPRPMREVDAGDVTDHVAAWQALYDETYGGPAPITDSTLNTVGWRSSYDGSQIAPEIMEEQVSATAARVMERHPRSVLEVGCGTGMLLFRIAPQCDEYHALDFSAEALDSIRRQPEFRNLTQVRLYQRAADNLSCFKPASFDCVVINSVVQYFPHHSYLTDVLRQASALVRPGGFVMVGDVRNHDLLHQFHTSIALSGKAATVGSEELRSTIVRQAQQEKELLLAPAFFRSLPRTVPAIAEVEIELRRGAHDSEIARFRYDAFLHFSRAASEPASILNYGTHPVTADQALRLAEATGEALAVCGIPNRRLLADHRAWLALSEGSAPPTIEELRVFTNQTQEDAQEPEEWWRVVEGTPYRAAVRPSSVDPSHFDVLLSPRARQPQRWPTPADPEDGLSAHLSNNPQEGQWLRSLPSTLRDFLRDRLPAHMVPQAIVLTAEMPTTANGKVDRGRLGFPINVSRATADDFIPPRTALEEQLCAIWSGVLGIDEVSVTADFFELGGHSLMVAHLVARVSAACQVDLPLRQFFENTSVAKTARWIEAARQGVQGDMGMLDLRAEARLDPQIAASVPAGPPLTGRVLLTGATGFVGGFLLQELLRTPGVSVLALVRDAADPAQALARLRRSLHRLGISEEEWIGRVTPITGDLSKPLLGLSGKGFDGLANSIDRVYHTGAVVNMVLPYHTLKPVNVSGTSEILRLSARVGGSTPVHYISSLATLYLMRPEHPQTEIPLSLDDLDQELLNTASSGYGVSKFVAEQLVCQASQAGIPVSTYRVGSVTGHSQTGVANTADFLHAMLRGALQLGCIPRDVRLDPVPVDFVTQSIAHLASHAPPSGSVFHITNPRPMEVDQFVAWADSRGFVIAPVDRKTWLRRINAQAAGEGHNLQSFSALLKMLVDYQGLHRFMQAQIRQPDMSNTWRGLASTDITCPPVTSDLLDTYLEHFLRTGFITGHPQAPLTGSAQRGEGR